MNPEQELFRASAHTSGDSILPFSSSCMTCRLGERITHYASLITAEKPLEAHRAYMAHRRSSMISVGQTLPVDVEVGGTYEVQADAGTSSLEQMHDDGGEYDYRAEDDAYWEEYRTTIVQR